MFKQLTNEEFLDKLQKNNVIHKPLEQYKGVHTRIKWLCKNNHIFKAEPCDIYNHKHHCPYCTNRKVLKGFNDMWTTNKEMAELLLDKNDGYLYMAGSSAKTDFVCPKCGSINNKSIASVNKYGLHCDVCSDNISYSEKFIIGLLKQLNVNFVHDKSFKWSDRKRYDFYIEDMSLIIETHGTQHYENSFHFKDNKRKNRTYVDELENDILKRNLAVKNGIEHYIELNCRESKLEYIKNSILNSEINNLFNLDFINWEEVEKQCNTSAVKTVIDLWNNNIKDTKEISNITGIHVSSVISYLKRGANSGLCDYFVNYKKCKSIVCVETGKIYKKITDVKKDGYNNILVGRCCNNKTKTAHGLHWAFIKKGGNNNA